MEFEKDIRELILASNVDELKFGQLFRQLQVSRLPEVNNSYLENSPSMLFFFFPLICPYFNRKRLNRTLLREKRK
jgi:hypothetical protein